MLRRILAILSAAGIAVLIGGAPSWATQDEGEQHVPVNVCHATSSDTNPYVFLTVDDDSTKFKGHLMHRSDPNKTWKSDGIWNGIEHQAGDPKADLIASYTDTAGTFFEYDGEITDCDDNTPVKPDPRIEVEESTIDRMTCDGVEERTTTVTFTTDYVFEDGKWVLGETVKTEDVGPWVFVRDLTNAEKQELECVEDKPTPTPTPTTEKPEPKPTPDVKTPELPHTGGEAWLASLAALLIASGGGIYWWTRRA